MFSIKWIRAETMKLRLLVQENDSRERCIDRLTGQSFHREAARLTPGPPFRLFSENSACSRSWIAPMPMMWPRLVVPSRQRGQCHQRKRDWAVALRPDVVAVPMAITLHTIIPGRLWNQESVAGAMAKGGQHAGHGATPIIRVSVALPALLRLFTSSGVCRSRNRTTRGRNASAPPCRASMSTNRIAAAQSDHGGDGHHHKQRRLKPQQSCLPGCSCTDQPSEERTDREPATAPARLRPDRSHLKPPPDVSTAGLRRPGLLPTRVKRQAPDRARPRCCRTDAGAGLHRADRAGSMASAIPLSPRCSSSTIARHHSITEAMWIRRCPATGPCRP